MKGPHEETFLDGETFLVTPWPYTGLWCSRQLFRSKRKNGPYRRPYLWWQTDLELTLRPSTYTGALSCTTESRIRLARNHLLSMTRLKANQLRLQRSEWVPSQA